MWILNNILCVLDHLLQHRYVDTQSTGASLVDQYPITLVHIVGFKIQKSNQYIVGIGGMRGLRWEDL